MWTYRIKYCKQGVIRFISHLDTMRALKRALGRARIPVAYSEGFNPRPKISMGPALPLGCESKCEMIDIVLVRSISPENLRGSLVSVMPQGLDILETDRVLPSSPRLSRASSVCYMIELPEGERFDEADSLVKAFNEKDSAPIERVRKDTKKIVDVRRFVLNAAIVTGNDSGWLSVEISISERGTRSPSEIIQAVFNMSPEHAKCLRAVRTDIKFQNR